MERCQDKWWNNMLYKKFFKGIKVILLAETLYGDVRKYVKRDDVCICPNGIPETVDNITVSQKIVVPRILFLSNMLIEKGVLVLLDALQILKGRKYSFVCDFVGGETADIDSVKFNNATTSRGLDAMVFYRGRKYGEEKRKILAQSDIFVFPTFYSNECFPLVLLEAMQHRLACISTDEGGIPDIIEDGKTGIIVQKNDAAGLADAIEKLLENDDLRQNMGVAGRRKYERHFTLSAFENNMTVLLDKIIANQALL